MFDNRKDPMIDTVQKVMVENARRRQIEADLNEELGIQDRKQLGHEKHDLYDQALLQRINEANEKPPFKPDPPRKKRPDEPTTARGLARKMMNKMKDKAAKDTQKTFPNVKHLTPAGNPDWHKHGYKDMPIKEEEQIDDERVLYSHSHSDTKVIRKSKKGDKEGSAIEVHKNGNKVATGDYDRGADAFFVNVGGKGQKSFDTAKDVANHFHDIKEEQIDELSKKTLGSYIKKASHDAAHKYANVGKMKLQSRTKYDEMDFVGGRKDNDAAGKSFRESWKRRESIAKAVDKLTNEDLSLESIQEEIRNNLLERANHLLENGSQEQIVEFMNDLTLEQRSILNMQEIFGIAKIASYAKGAIAGLRGGRQASNAAALGNKATQAGADVGGNVRRAVEPVADKVSNAGKAVVGAIKDNPVKSVVGAAAVGALGTKAIDGTSTATPAAAPAAAKPDISSGDESAGLNMNKPNYGPNKPAAQQQAAAKPAETPRAAASSAPRASAPRASAPAAARPEIRRTGVDGTESAQDFNYNQASGAYNEPKAAAAPRAARAAPAAAKPATAAAKPAAAATLAPRSGSEIRSPVAGGDDRLVPELERLGDTQHHNSQDAAANLAGQQKSATDSAVKTADAFGPGTQTAKSAAAKPANNRREPSVSSFKVDAPSKTADMPDDAQKASDSGIHGMGTPPPKTAAKPVADPREGGSSSGRQNPNISESRNFERFLRNR